MTPAAAIATARAAMDALSGAHHGVIEVVGDGPLAEALREMVDARPRRDGPSVIIDASGESSALRDALQRSDELGTVILAAPPVDETVDVATYADLHLRGVVVRGVLTDPV